MMHRALIPACLTLITACSDGSPVEPAPARPSPPTFLVFGIVENVEGIPLRGALVELFAPGPLLIDSTVTGVDGGFGFGGVRGYVQLKVSRSGYFVESRSLNVTEDHLYRFQLAPWPEADVLILGDWIQASVIGGAPPCDPIYWDAYAPCRRFLFSPMASGKLVISLEWTGYPELDATLVTSAGDYVGTSDGTGVGRFHLEGQVLEGQVYEVRVNSYYGTQDFRLMAELIP